MKNKTNSNENNKASVVRKRKVGFGSRGCREMTQQLADVKRALVREYGATISGQGQLLNSALNEAEALAWQTGYPHLLFPMLAQEKATAVTHWAARQRSIHRASRQIALAA